MKSESEFWAEREQVVTGSRCGECWALLSNGHYFDCPRKALEQAAKELMVWTAGMGGRIREARKRVMDALDGLCVPIDGQERSTLLNLPSKEGGAS